MTSTCIGATRKARSRMFACVDIFVSVVSFALWIPLFMEASAFSAPHWDLRLLPHKTITSIQWHCGPHFFLLFSPSDIGAALGKSVVLFVLSSLGFLLSALFLAYATISSEESAKVLLATFLVTQIPLLALCVVALVSFQTDVLCFFDHDGDAGDEGRGGRLLLLLLAFLLLYKPLQLLHVSFHWRHLTNKVFLDDVPWAERSPYETLGGHLPPPGSPSLPSSSSQSEASVDINMNDVPKKSGQPPPHDNNNSEAEGPLIEGLLDIRPVVPTHVYPPVPHPHSQYATY